MIYIKKGNLTIRVRVGGQVTGNSGVEWPLIADIPTFRSAGLFDQIAYTTIVDANVSSAEQGRNNLHDAYKRLNKQIDEYCSKVPNAVSSTGDFLNHLLYFKTDTENGQLSVI